jgi:hypothetical protein
LAETGPSLHWLKLNKIGFLRQQANIFQLALIRGGTNS